MVDDLAQAIADAIAAFDAANLAWGQFYQHTWRGRGEAARAQAQPLREALGEAAISVPASTSGGSADALRVFVVAIEAARVQLRQFISAVGADLVPGDIRDLDMLLDEAAGYVRPYMGPGPTGR